MKTKEQIEAEFRKDLQELLDIYGAEIELTYGENGSSMEAAINVSIDQHFGDEGQITEEYCAFNL